MNLEELEARVRALEDIEAIKKITAAFAYNIDSGDWQGVVDLFTEDGVCVSGNDRYKARAGLTRFFKEDLPAAFGFTVHMLHNPIIELKGEEASGVWYSEVPVTHNETNRAWWIASKYKATYQKVAGEWKFKTFASSAYYMTPFDEGWVKTRMYGS